MKTLTAKVVPYSSIVGQSVTLHDETGKVIAMLIISVPNPDVPFKETAIPLAERIAGYFNADWA